MRGLQLSIMLLLCSCSAEIRPPTSTPADAVAPEQKTVIPDYGIDAFGGRLLGTDRGEWVGKLMFLDAQGNLETVLDENVHGIIRNPEGVFVFTGIAHGSINEGNIYVVTGSPDGAIVASRLGRLPGAPSRVSQTQLDGATSFLVYSGFDNNRPLFQCYQLVDKIVSRGQDCLPPD